MTLGHAFRGDLDLDSPGATWMLSISTLICASVWWICTDLQHESEGKLIFWSLVFMSWIFKFPQSFQQLQALVDTQFLIDVSLTHWFFIVKHQGHVVKSCQRRFQIHVFFFFYLKHCKWQSKVGFALIMTRLKKSSNEIERVNYMLYWTVLHLFNIIQSSLPWQFLHY